MFINKCNYSVPFILITFLIFQFDKVELKIKRRGIVSLSPSCASFTEGYEYLPAAGRFSPVGAKSLNT